MFGEKRTFTKKDLTNLIERLNERAKILDLRFTYTLGEITESGKKLFAVVEKNLTSHGVLSHEVSPQLNAKELSYFIEGMLAMSYEQENSIYLDNQYKNVGINPRTLEKN